MKWLKRLAGAIVISLAVNGGAVSAASQANIDLSQPNVLDLPEWEMTSTDYGGKLLLSDSPETVPADGIMYQDTVSGDVRLFFHHVNGTKEAKKIVVLLENPGKDTASVTVYQHGLGGPGYDYLEVGKAVQLQYLSVPDTYLVEVPGHDTRQLIYQLNDAVVEPNQLVNGMYDFHTDKPVTVKVMMLPVNMDVKKFAAQAKVLPADEWRLRGTFAGRDRMILPNRVYDAAKHGTVAITLADNEIDRYMEGIDATDGSKVVNYGNYGVVYRMFMPSEYNGSINFYLNPRGGEYAGALGIKYQHVVGQPLATPYDRLFFGSKTVKDVQLLGSFVGGQSLWFTFSPPGASNLPVKLVLSPKQ